MLCYAYCVLCLLLIHANSLKIYLLWQVAKKSLCKHGGGGVCLDVHEIIYLNLEMTKSRILC